MAFGKDSGSSPSVTEVRAKSLSELYTEAVNTSIDNLPKLYDAYAKYGPEYANVANQIFQNQVPIIQGAFNDANPLLKPTQQYALNQLNQASTNQIPNDILAPFYDSLRTSQAARGMAESPISALTEAEQLGGLSQTYKQQAFQNAYNLTLNDPTSQALQALLPVPQTASQLNLVPANLNQLTQTGQNQESNRINAEFEMASANQQATNKQIEINNANKKKTGQLIGAVVGGIGGSFAGAPLQGAQIGSQAGGYASTFF